ncbi:MAG: hypothetical protein VCC36_06140 [Gammaproteobacteria bacterium]
MQNMMMRVVAVSALALGAGHAFAHEDFRVIGTVMSHQDSSIEVQSRDGTMTSIRLDRQTLITRDTKTVAAAQLEIGVSVVVDAYGDSTNDLLALDIRIVSPIATQ